MSVIKLPVPVKQGGTGADNAADARANLGINSEFPIGALAYYPNANGDSYLTGGVWLKCDGQIISQTTYSVLFSRMGLINPGASIWETRTGTTTSIMRAGANSGSLAMFVGDVGSAQTSTNGGNWIATKSTGTALNLAALTYGGGKFVAAGATYIATSTDGNQWQTKTPNANVIGFVNSKVVAAGPAGLIYTSTDGFHFDSQNSNFIVQINCLAYGSSIYLLGANVSTILSSTDAITWTTTIPGPATNYTCAAYGNGIFMINNGANVITSTNAITWSQRTTGAGSNLNSFDFGAGLWIAVGASGVMRNSTDGITWGAGVSGTSSTLATVKYLNSLFLYGGNGGTIATSADGLTWLPRTSNTTSSITAFTYGGLYVYGTINGGLGSSTDGITWTARTSGVASTILSLAYDGVHYLGAGAGFTLSSTDAITWVVNTPASASNILALAYGASTYLAMGAGGMALSSTDAFTWTPRTTGTTSSIVDVAFLNSLFVAVGQGGLIYSSTDAITWTQRTSGTTLTLNAIEYTDRYVACGNSGVLLTSTNAITWTANTSLGTTINLVNLAYAGSVLAGIGNSGYIFRSDDSVNFYPQISSTISNIALTSGQGLFMISGNPGTAILISSQTYSYNNTTSFQLPTDAGLAIVTEVTNNFKRSLYIKVL